MTGAEVLNIRMDSSRNDAEVSSIKEYLKTLLTTLWDEGESFSGKRPFGNSGWEYELYLPLLKEGAVTGSLDGEGYLVDVDTEAANKLIFAAIDAL